MNRDLRRIAHINVKNFSSQRQKNLRFLALSSSEPWDHRDLQQGQRGPKLTPVRCERIDCNLPVDIIHLSEDNIWDYIQTHDWSSGSSLRICEGSLLHRILDTLHHLCEDGYVITQKSARFDTCCFPKNPTAIKLTNLYEKNMIPETVKISFCNFAINLRQPHDFLIKVEKKRTMKNGENIPDERKNEKNCEEFEEKHHSIVRDIPSSNSSDQHSLPWDFIFVAPKQDIRTGHKLEQETSAILEDEIEKISESRQTSENAQSKLHLEKQEDDNVGVSKPKTPHVEAQEKNERASESEENSELSLKKSRADEKITDDDIVSKSCDEKFEKDTTESSPADNENPESGDNDSNVDQAETATKSRQSICKSDVVPEESCKGPRSDESCSLAKNDAIKDKEKDPDNLGCEDKAKLGCHPVKAKGPGVDESSKLTKSQTVMIGDQKLRKKVCCYRKVDPANGTTSMISGKSIKASSLEYDHHGQPKFRPSFETVVDVAEFKFNRCSSDSDDDSDCDRTPWKQRMSNENFKDSMRKKSNEQAKTTNSNLKKTLSPYMHCINEESEGELVLLNGVPPAPIRSDVKSLKDYFRIRRNLKYGEKEEKIVHCRATYDQTSLQSTQGMSYFNSKLSSSKLPPIASYLSLPQAPPSSIPTTTEADLHKASNEAVCGSHGKLCFVNAHTSDTNEDESLDDERGLGTLRLMNVKLLNRIKPTYSTDRLSNMVTKGKLPEPKRVHLHRAQMRRIRGIVKDVTAVFNKFTTRAILQGLHNRKYELARAQLPSIERCPPSPNDKKILQMADPSRPVNGMYKTTKPGAKDPDERYHIENSPSADLNQRPVSKYFTKEVRLDLRQHLLQAIQEFVVVKETVIRPAGRGTIVSLTIHKPKRYKYGTARQICEESNVYDERMPNAPYPTPKNSRNPL